MIAAKPTLVVLRVAGPWRHMRDLAQRLPSGWRLSGQQLLPPAGPALELELRKADKEFPKVFRTGSMRRPAPRRELRRVDRAKHIACVAGCGGSLQCSRLMMSAGAAVVRAGGAGVFIDNSGLAHGGSDWTELADHQADLLTQSYAFVNFAGLNPDISSMGMHVFGEREAVIAPGRDPESALASVEDFIRDTLARPVPWTAGDCYRDVAGRKFSLREEKQRSPWPQLSQNNPMRNPYGAWRLKPIDAKGSS